MLASLFDSFKHYRQDQGELLLYFIQEYLSDGRLVRITGQNGLQRYVPLVRQDDTITFDVIVDDMPESPNNKERVWNILQTLLPTLMKAGMPAEMLPVLMKYSPLPETVSIQFKQMMDQKAQQGPNPAQIAEIEKIKAETHETNAQAGLNEAKAASEMVKSHIDAVAAMALTDPLTAPPGSVPAQQMPQQGLQQ
jgi:hypothetical protein